MAEIIRNQGFIDTEFKIFRDGTFDVKRTQDVEPFLNFNKWAQNDSDFNNGYTPSGDLKHVAKIPLIIIEKWAKEAGLKRSEMLGPKMTDIIKAKLNDPDWAYLRTGGGRI